MAPLLARPEDDREGYHERSLPRPERPLHAVAELDALHLASIGFLRARGQSIALASYDEQLVAAARALGIAIASL